jgi:hypothetical protein
VTSRNWTTRACIAALALLVCAAPASAQDSGDWIRDGHSKIPVEYYQGISSGDGDVFFSGFKGIFATDQRLRELRRNPDVIDPAAQRDPGFNHIGDLTWDEKEGGRIVLPLECYDPTKNPSNTCGVGGFGVADAGTLRWSYWVKLDPADIPKAMWAEVSPDGRLIWTSSGDDLLAYNVSDLTRANAQPAGPLIKPARQLAGAVPDHGITGATFVGRRLFLAGQDDARFQVTSLDLTTGVQRREIERTINGESEGLDTYGGRLHWMVMPLSFTGPATFPGTGALLRYKPRPTRLRLTVKPRRPRVGRRTRFTFRVTDNNGDAVRRATVNFARARARTDRRGRVRITRTLTRPGRYTAKATRRGLKGARVVVRSSR